MLTFLKFYLENVSLCLSVCPNKPRATSINTEGLEEVRIHMNDVRWLRQGNKIKLFSSQPDPPVSSGNSQKGTRINFVPEHDNNMYMFTVSMTSVMGAVPFPA